MKRKQYTFLDDETGRTLQVPEAVISEIVDDTVREYVGRLIQKRFRDQDISDEIMIASTEYKDIKKVADEMGSIRPHSDFSLGKSSYYYIVGGKHYLKSADKGTSSRLSKTQYDRAYELYVDTVNKEGR